MIGLKVLLTKLNNIENQPIKLGEAVKEYLQEIHNNKEVPFENVIDRIVSNFVQLEYYDRRSSAGSKRMTFHKGVIAAERSRTLSCNLFV